MCLLRLTVVAGPPALACVVTVAPAHHLKIWRPRPLQSQAQAGDLGHAPAWSGSQGLRKAPTCSRSEFGDSGGRSLQTADATEAGVAKLGPGPAGVSSRPQCPGVVQIPGITLEPVQKPHLPKIGSTTHLSLVNFFQLHKPAHMSSLGCLPSSSLWTDHLPPWNEGILCWTLSHEK